MASFLARLFLWMENTMDKRGNNGHHNTGYWNTGTGNTGDCNRSSWCSGSFNWGPCCSGNYNLGAHCSGSWNLGDRASGFLNTESNLIYIFDQPYIGEPPEFPGFFYFDFPDPPGLVYHDAWRRAFREMATPQDCELLLQLPNFCFKLFHEITGITEEMIRGRLNGRFRRYFKGCGQNKPSYQYKNLLGSCRY